MFKAISPRAWKILLHYFLVSNFADEEDGINPVLIPTCSELNSVPPSLQKKKNVHVVTPSTCECDPLWKKNVCRYN